MAPRKKNDAAKKKPTKAEQAATLAKSDDIERVRVTKDVPQSASTGEAQRMSLEHADVTLKISSINDEIAEFMSVRRKKLRELRKEDLRLAKAVKNNTVMKRMSVVEVRDYKTNQLRYEDADGKPIPGLEPVVMPAETRQRTLFEGDSDGPRVAAEEEADGDEEELDEDEEPEDDE